MASSIARRIASTLVLLVVASVAFADWGGNHYCRLNADRLVIFSAGKRFVLVHAAAWELADPSQQNDFDKWLTQTKLSKDIGQLISGAPIDHAYPFLGELRSTVETDAATLRFEVGGDTKVVKLTKSETGFKPDADSVVQFDAAAKALGRSPSDLLVILSDSSEKISDQKAWGLLVNRMRAKQEFFAPIDKTHGILWITREGAEPIPVKQPETSPTEPKPKPTGDKPADKSDSGGGFPVAWVGTGVGCLVLGVGIGYALRKSPIQAPQASPKFIATSKERELIDMVRSEIARLGWEANHVPSGEEYIVGQVLERFNRHEALSNQIEHLQSYRRFAEDHNSFQKQIDMAVAESRSSRQTADEHARQLGETRARMQTLTDQLKNLESENVQTRSNLVEAEKLVDDMASWIAYLDEKLVNLAEQMQDE